MLDQFSLSDVASLIVLGLAGWRTGFFIVYDEGAFGFMFRLRRALKIEHDDNGTPVAYPDTWVGGLLNCVWCASFWTTVALYGIVMLSPIPVMILAAWGLACLIHKGARPGLPF